VNNLTIFGQIASAGLMAVALAQPVVAADDKSEVERIEKSIAVLNELVSTPDNGIPQHILDRAEAIVVIPSLVKGGFVLGAEHGKGVMSVRNRAANNWSLPSFVAMTGGSIGWQIGVQSTDLVLLVMNKSGVDDLLKSEFKFGPDASIAAGPIGRSAQASTDPSFNSKILAYSRAKGVFAGLSVQGSSLRDDKDSNGDFYGKELTASEVFAMSPTTPPAIATRWQETLRTVAAAAR
jgi:SH3 domain-containing YSC84-like protein 1